MEKQIITIALLLALVGSSFAQTTSTTPEAININFINRGYFYAASPPMASTSGYGGWGQSGNLYQPIDSESSYDKNKLTVLVDVNKPDLFAEKYQGITLYVANTCADTVFFNVQDSRLNMKLQALDKDGVWKDIEYLPSSWCGNSYHQLYLPSGNYWKFTIPVYHGKMKTKIRAVLSFANSIEGEEQLVYSNEFEGSINSGQFSKMPKYKPNGMMDPYNN